MPCRSSFLRWEAVRANVTPFSWVVESAGADHRGAGPDLVVLVVGA